MSEEKDVSLSLLNDRRSFIQKIPATITSISDAWDVYCMKRSKETFGNIFNEVVLFCQLLRNLGLVSLGRKAMQLHNGIKKLQVSPQSLSKEDLSQISKFIADLDNASRVFLRKYKELKPGEEEALANMDLEEKHVLLLSMVKAEFSGLEPQLKPYGYRLMVFDSLADLRKELEQTKPVAVLFDINRSPNPKQSMVLVREIGKIRDSGTPVIYLVRQSNDIIPWIEGVRSGADLCLSKPLEIAGLVAKLDFLNQLQQEAAYRVLLVNDDKGHWEPLAQAMKDAGMVVSMLAEPFKIMGPLIEFKPDLILMGLDLPGCNGLDVAKVIRQHETFITIPIVYYGDLEKTRQLEVINLAGDDFLVEPVNPKHLILLLKNRISKARKIRQHFSRDQLTGLPYYTALKQALDVELARATRQKKKFVFALIDVDRLHIVNDTYGHACGDIVLKSLAQLLKGRLRKTDIIGRSGGEEFAVLLWDVDDLVGSRIINELRWHFSRIKQQFRSMRFHVTFSAGLACFPKYQDVISLTKAAETALMQAKAKGRNDVVVMD